MMNALQNEYVIAKALMELSDGMESRLERDYMARHGLKDANGETPRFLWMLPDVEGIEEHITACCEEIEATGFYKEKHAAPDRLRKAENALLDMGLSLVPADTRQTLEKACRTRYIILEQIIDLAMRLNPATIPATEA